MKKKKIDTSVLPFIIIPLVLIGSFVIMLCAGISRQNRLRSYWTEAAVFMNGRMYAPQDDGTYIRLSPRNQDAFCAILSGELLVRDRSLATTGEAFDIYVNENDFLYRIKVERTESERRTRITVNGKKYTYVYDLNGLNYYEKLLKAASAEGFHEPNRAVSELPFSIQ